MVSSSFVVGEASTEHFVWDRSGSLPLLLSDAHASYVYGPDGTPIEQIDGTRTPTYYHHDAIGSTRLLTDASGEPTATFSYAPFGTATGSTGTQTTPLGFAGEYTDAESGLQYLRARYLDPATGQFMSRDPLEDATGEPYAYAGDTPLVETDPTGMLGWSDLAGAGMFVSDAAAGALNEITLGRSNRIAGVDGSCAGAGYGWGSKGGFAASMIGGSEIKGLLEAEKATTAFGRMVQDVKAGNGFVRESAHIEPAVGRRYRGGISREEVFTRGNDRVVRHQIYDADGRLVHETHRDHAKFGAH